jgi:hypothetical protein
MDGRRSPTADVSCARAQLKRWRRHARCVIHCLRILKEKRLESAKRLYTPGTSLFHKHKAHFEGVQMSGNLYDEETSAALPAPEQQRPIFESRNLDWRMSLIQDHARYCFCQEIAKRLLPGYRTNEKEEDWDYEEEEFEQKPRTMHTCSRSTGGMAPRERLAIPPIQPPDAVEQWIKRCRSGCCWSDEEHVSSIEDWARHQEQQMLRLTCSGCGAALIPRWLPAEVAIPLFHYRTRPWKKEAEEEAEEEAGSEAEEEAGSGEHAGWRWPSPAMPG